MLDAGSWMLDNRRAGHRARRPAWCFQVPIHFIGMAGLTMSGGRIFWFIQNLASSIQHRLASSNGTFTPPTRRFEAELR